jgi:hypothetical protein
MADKVCQSRPLIGPGPKRGRIASRERISLDFKEKTITFSLKNFFFIDSYCLKVCVVSFLITPCFFFVSFFFLAFLAIICLPYYSGSAMLGKSQQATAPLLWIPGCMEDTVDCHLPTGILVKDGVRKSPQQRPTILLMDFRVEFGHATNCLDTGVRTAEKLFPQTRSTIFVPTICLIDVLLCFRRDY